MEKISGDTRKRECAQGRQGSQERSWTFQDAIRLALSLHNGQPFGEHAQAEWLRITGTKTVSAKVLCDHLQSVLGGGGSFINGSASEHGERVYGLAVGHVLTEQDVADIQAMLNEHNEEIGEACTAWHHGRIDGLREVGGDALVEAVQAKDKAFSDRLVDRALAQLREADRAAKPNLTSCPSSLPR